jgi:pre-rRNA-processing protein TSR1
MHYKIQRHFENTEPIPSKHEVLLHCGFRVFTVRPLFSQEPSPGQGDKLKYMRFLRPDVSAIASVYMPIIFSPCKVLVFTRHGEALGHLKLLATGHALAPNPLTVILKRITLTGYPLKVHKKKAVVRYMFFNPKDVKYFKPVELTTKFGLRGHIKDSLGTHGLMKCQFNDFMKQNDTVCMPLYKRIYPAWFEHTWKGGSVPTINDEEMAIEDEAEPMA